MNEKSALVLETVFVRLAQLQARYVGIKRSSEGWRRRNRSNSNNTLRSILRLLLFALPQKNSEGLQAEVLSLRAELGEKQARPPDQLQCLPNYPASFSADSALGPGLWHPQERLAQLEQDRESMSEQWQAIYHSEVSSAMGAGKVAVELERERKLKAVEELLAASDEAAVKHKEELQALELALSRQREEVEALRALHRRERLPAPPGFPFLSLRALFVLS